MPAHGKRRLEETRSRTSSWEPSHRPRTRPNSQETDDRPSSSRYRSGPSSQETEEGPSRSRPPTFNEIFGTPSSEIRRENRRHPHGEAVAVMEKVMNNRPIRDQEFEAVIHEKAITNVQRMQLARAIIMVCEWLRHKNWVQFDPYTQALIHDYSKEDVRTLTDQTAELTLRRTFQTLVLCVDRAREVLNHKGSRERIQDINNRAESRQIYRSLVLERRPDEFPTSTRPRAPILVYEDPV